MKINETHLTPKIGQYALIRNGKNEILMLERGRSKNWTLPGGRLNIDDRDWKQAFKREIHEELGIDDIDFKPFDIKLIEDQYQVKYCVFFLASINDQESINISEEHCSYKWIGVSDLDDLVVDDEPKVRSVLEKYFNVQ